MQIQIDGQSFDLDYMLFNKSKLIRVANIAKQYERDAISMFKTIEERDKALASLCKLNRKVEEILHDAN